MKQAACNYRVSAKALVVRDGLLLLVQEGSSQWDLPGGGIEHGEDIFGGLRREILEETSLEVADIDTRPITIGIGSDPVSGLNYLQVVYLASVRLADISHSTVDRGTAWLSPREVATVDLEPRILALRQSMLNALNSQILCVDPGLPAA